MSTIIKKKENLKKIFDKSSAAVREPKTTHQTKDNTFSKMVQNRETIKANSNSSCQQ